MRYLSRPIFWPSLCLWQTSSSQCTVLLVDQVYACDRLATARPLLAVPNAQFYKSSIHAVSTFSTTMSVHSSVGLIHTTRSADWIVTSIINRAEIIWSFCLSVNLWAGLLKKEWANFIETWCHDWAYQPEQLVNFWWGSGPRCGLRITFPFSSPLRKTGFKEIY